MSDATAVAVGFFDGVHLGHREVISRAVNNSKGLVPAVFSFRLMNQSGKRGEKLICTYEKREFLTEELGTEIFLCPKFTDFSAFSPERFVEEVLSQRMKAAAVFCGLDFRFGAHGAGDVLLLRELCGARKIDVQTVENIGGIEKISSSGIKRLLDQGDVSLAAQQLGRSYSIEGKVMKGQGLGRELGFPTANITPHNSLHLPRLGVYFTNIKDIGPAVTNIGMRPTVGGKTKIVCESFVLGFSGDLYDKNIEVSFKHFLRPEKRFSSVEALVAEVKQNVCAAKEYFGI